MKTRFFHPFLMLFIWAFWMVVPPLHSQEKNTPDWSDFMESLTEMMSETGDAETLDEELVEDLYELHCNPLNLNDLDKEKLRELPFLNDIQIMDLILYTESHKPLLSTGELMAIRSLDYWTRRLLQLFCYAGELPKPSPTLSDAIRFSNNDLMLRTDIPLYTKMGFAHYGKETLAKSPNKIYRGSQPYYSLRYTFSTLNKVEAGIQMEKDVGESGIDYFSAYALVKNMGIIDRLVVGNYRLSFGLGLVTNSSSSFGKLMMLSSLGRMDRGIRKHSSMMESGYFSGVATTVNLLKNLHLTAFYSNQKTDGTFNADSSGISSLKTDGLHRTLLEKSKKGNIRKQDFGGSLSWQWNQLKIGANVSHSHFSVPLAPKHDTDASFYRRYNATGTDFTNYSLSYSYLSRLFRLHGETASGSGGGVATLNSLQTEWRGNTFTFIQRYYGAKYVSINGKTFSENAQPQNELGFFLGWKRYLSRSTLLQAYFDYMHFPWMKYGVSQASNAFDVLAQLQHQFNDEHSLSVRYRMKSKQKDLTFTGATAKETYKELGFNTTHSLRIQYQANLSESIQLKTLLLGSMVSNKADGNRFGFGVGESLNWKFSTPWIHLKSIYQTNKGGKMSINLTYFHTDDYESRIYAYEPSLLYTFGMHSFYYEGIRLALLAQVPIIYRLYLVTKLGSTRYFNRSTIGTGLDQILHNHREDLQLQLQWKF